MTGWPHTLYSYRPVLGQPARINEALGRAEDAARMPYWLVWAEIEAGRCGPGLVARALAP